MARRKSRAGIGRSILRQIGAELRDNPPRVLASTRRKFGPRRAEKQRVAILLSKARRAGLRVPLKRGRRKRVSARR